MSFTSIEPSQAVVTQVNDIQEETENSPSDTSLRAVEHDDDDDDLRIIDQPYATATSVERRPAAASSVERRPAAAVDEMEDLSDDEKVEAYDVFKDAQNRAIFMTAKDSTRLILEG